MSATLPSATSPSTLSTLSPAPAPEGREARHAGPGRRVGFAYRPDIEGLRAVAVLLVVAFHAGVPGLGGGLVGVDVFFVLSGYLITGLLVEEASRTDRIDLVRFYARRVRRLLPAVAALLVVTIPASMVLYAPLEQRGLARSWAATALYASNVDFVARALDYNGADAARNPLLHTWSLSVEEQLYLVWPWLVLAGLGLLTWRSSRRIASERGPRTGSDTLCWLLGATTALSLVASAVLTRTASTWAFYLMPTRAWEFGAGALAVLVPLRRARGAGGVATHVVGWLALAGLAVAATWYGRTTPFPGVAALLPVGATVALLRAGAPTAAAAGAATVVASRGAAGSVSRALALAPLQALGRLSYSWYLWHWPALVFAAAIADPLPARGRAAAIAVSLILAVASYRWVETPLRHSRALAARPWRSLALAVGLACAMVATWRVWLHASVRWSEAPAQARITAVADQAPAHYGRRCDRFGHAEVVACAYGDTTARRTAVLFGDSHAAQWFPAVRAAADSAHVRLVVVTLSGCPFVATATMYNDRLRRPYRECDAWRAAALDTIAQLAPAVTFVGAYGGYPVAPGAWAAGTRTTVSALARGGGRVVVVLDTPLPGFDVPTCLARAAWRPRALRSPCTVRTDRWPGWVARGAAQDSAARTVPGVDVLDLRDEVCAEGTCDPRQGALIRYRDDNHLSGEFARTFSSTFYRYLVAGE